MRRLTALGAVWLILAGLGSAALAQGLSDVRLGNEAFRQGDYTTAVDHYTDAIRSGELVGEALAITYNNRGVAYGEAGDFDPAIADYSQALALRPGDATTIRNLRVAHVRRGELSFASGTYDAAIADFTLATVLEADHHLAYQRRGELYVELGLLDLAVDDLERAAMLSPGDPEIVAALERATDRRDEVLASVDRASPAIGEPMPMAGVAEAPEPEEPIAELPETQESPSPVDEDAAETAEAAAPEADEPPAAEPTVAARPEPAPRAAAVEPPAAVVPVPEASAREAPGAEPAPLAAAETTEPAREIDITPAAPTPTAPTPAPAQTAAADGEPYRVISAVNYRAGPDNDAPRLGTVDAGRVVRVTGDTLGWKHVSLPNGDSGFIYQTWLEPVTE